MKSRSFRLPDDIIEDIEAEARRRKVSATEVVRERLSGAASPATSRESWKDSLANFVGAVDELPHGGDSRNIKAALKASGYGRNRSR
jgi:Arc/MetJ-type ribon-helix-helix transcriptional regulator